MRKSLPLLCGAMLAASLPVLAQAPDHDTHADQSSRPGMMQGGMMQGGMMQGRGGMGPMLGEHMLAATVTAIDAKTGIIDVTAGAMALKLHFPPAALAGIKSGDKIQVHLAFHKQ